ncbi:MAG TPA: transposase, partial [Ignavibacteria bacterium]
ARWTQKNGDDYYGYKNHIKIDGKSKLIDTYMVSDASVHDSKVLDMLLRKRMKINHFMPTVHMPEPNRNR